jgi:hypothetical protein
LESKYSTHEKNTQIHTSQAEKDAWNGKAVIKGLEGANVQIYDGDLNEIKHTSCYDITPNSPNSPIPAGQFSIMHTFKTKDDVYGITCVQEISSRSENSLSLTYRRRFAANYWTPWKLIAQDQEGVAKIKGLESGSVKDDYTVDFNTIKTNWASISRNNPNRPPTNEYGILSVYGDGFTAIQTFMNVTGADLVYKRSLAGGNWQPWKLIAQDQEGVAKIKGLESVNGVEEKPNTWNGFNELKTSEYLIIGGNPNAPSVSWGVLKTRTNGSHAGYQEYRTIDGYVYHRYFGNAKWGSWRLIAQPQTVLTSRIEELEEKINHLEIALRNTKDTQ